MSELHKLKEVLARCAPYFRTWVSVALDSHDWFIAGPFGELHKCLPVYGQQATKQSVATYRLLDEADYNLVGEALEYGIVGVYTEEPGREGLIFRWSNLSSDNGSA